MGKLNEFIHWLEEKPRCFKRGSITDCAISRFFNDRCPCGKPHQCGIGTVYTVKPHTICHSFNEKESIVHISFFKTAPEGKKTVSSRRILDYLENNKGE